MEISLLQKYMSFKGTAPAITKYYPYGECRNSTGDLGTDKLFTGQRLDDTGLYYYGARYYDPTIGRFISADPVIKSLNPQNFNRYSYVLNNPLKYIDPPGYVWTTFGTSTIDGRTYTIQQEYGSYRVADLSEGSYSGSMKGLSTIIAYVGTEFDRVGDYSYGGNYDSGPVVRVDVQTNLRAEPIPVNYVPEGSEQAKDLGNYGGRSLGFNISGFKFGVVNLRYQIYTAQELAGKTWHECFHYYEQTSEGLSWYAKYGVEYAVSRAFGSDHDSAYRNLTDEGQARMYEVNPSSMPPGNAQMLWDSFKQSAGSFLKDLITDMSKLKP